MDEPALRDCDDGHVCGFIPCRCVAEKLVRRMSFDYQNLAMVPSTNGTYVNATDYDAQSLELQAVREALGTLRDYAFKAAVLNDSDHIRGNSIKAHKMLMALAGMSPGYDHKIDAALKQSRGAM